MHQAFLIVSVVLLLLDFLLWWMPTTNPPWAGRLQSLGLAFGFASFLVS